MAARTGYQSPSRGGCRACGSRASPWTRPCRGSWSRTPLAETGIGRRSSPSFNILFLEGAASSFFYRYPLQDVLLELLLLLLPGQLLSGSDIVLVVYIGRVGESQLLD